MTFPIPSSALPDTSLVTAAQLNSKIYGPVNGLGGFLYGEDDGLVSDTVTLSSTADFLAAATFVTFTLAATRRVRVVTAARFQMTSGASGLYVVTSTYVAGGSATLTGAVKLGQAGANTFVVTVAGNTGTLKGGAEHSVLLTAGTYTAFPVVSRAAGGSATDTAALAYCAVYDAGNA